MSTRFLILAVSAALAISGCSFLADSSEDTLGGFPSYEHRAVQLDDAADGKQVRGILHFYGDDADVDIPTSVAAGQPLELTITTFGGGCENAGGAAVDVDGDLATIEPYDFTVADANTACPDVLKFMPRTVALTFNEPGRAVVRIVGLRVDAEHRNGDEIVVEKTVTVD